MNIPEVTIVGGVQLWQWKEYGVRATLERFYEDSRYALSAEATFTLDSAIYPEILHPHLHQERLNLTSGVSKKRLANLLTEQRNGIPWPVLIEQLCVLAIRTKRAGEPVIRVGNNPPRTEERWQLYPLLRMGQPTVIYGAGGLGKSFLADVCALLVATGIEQAGLAPTLDNVLYLDYEGDADTINERLRALKVGFSPGLELAEIHYRYCHQLLANEINELQKIVADLNIGLLIVDSLTGATAGKVQDNDVNTALFNALRSLKRTVLCIDHVRKNDPDGPLGAITKYNRARAVWEVQRVQDVGSNEFKIGLYNPKSNDGKLFHPIGLQFKFDGADPPQKIMFSKVNISDVPELQVKLSLADRIEAVLKHGALPIQDIYEQINTYDPSVTDNRLRNELSRSKKRFVSVNRGVWGLTERENS